MGNCLENCCPHRNYETIPDKTSHGASPDGYGERIQRITDDLNKGEEEKRLNAEKEKQAKLSQFLKTDNGAPLTIAEHNARLERAEREKQAKFEEEKANKLNAFLKVDNEANGAPKSLLEKAEQARIQNEQEKQRKFEEEKQAKLAAFVAPVAAPAPTAAVAQTPTKDVSPTTTSSNGSERLKSTNEKLEEAKRNKQNLEERLAKLKAERLKKK